MVAFADTFQNWKDFPKGLSVLVVDTDKQFLHDIRCKLQSYEYIVTSFSSGQEACAALANKEHIYHVALVEATDSDHLDSCKVLEFSRHIPMIMISGTENMLIMVKTIALGAVEFLLKPLSEDKLKNIWQHVVRKAIDSKDVLQAGYLEPGRNNVVSRMHDDNHHMGDSEENNASSAGKACHENELLSIKVAISSERLPAPTTPQLERGERQETTLDESLQFHDSIDGQELKRGDEKLSISSLSKSDSKEMQPSIPDIISWKNENDFNDQIEVTCCTTQTLETAAHYKDAEGTHTSFTGFSGLENENSTKEQEVSKDDERSMSEVNKAEMLENQSMGESIIVQSDVSQGNVDCLNTDSMSSSQSFEHQNRKDNAKRKSASSDQTGKENRSNNKKKPKVDWTAELHQQFVQAIESLGVEQAIPSKILEVMKVDGLTRHNIASHLQKYRSQRRHHYSKEMGVNSWHHNRIPSGKAWNRVGQTPTWIQPRAPMIFPPLHVWGHPAVENSAIHVMPQYAYSNAWQTFDNPLLKHSMAPGIPFGTACYVPHMLVGAHQESSHLFSASVDSLEATNKYENNSKSLDNNQSKELLDAAIREALSNPWRPLPLGLKPPSMESVMAELQRQGIDTVTLYMN